MSDEMLARMRADDNWRSAFAYASGVQIEGQSGVPVSVGEPPVSAEPFNYGDVAHVEAISDSSAQDWDGWDGVLVCRLEDGRWASLAASCDYTGWDCQAGGDSRVAASLANIVRWGLTVGQRERLGQLLPDDTGSLR